MAKIRDYTYGSPKFEREINKAVSGGGGGKLYLHKIFMGLMGANDFSMYYAINVYSTDNTPLFTLENQPTVADVTAFITPYLNDMTKTSPTYIEDGGLYQLTVESNVLKGIAISLADLQQLKRAITVINGAMDTVVEV